MADVYSRDKRSFCMSQIHSKDTKLEILVRKYLFSNGLRFRKNDRRYPGCPDIVLPKYKTVVFLNGCFWHGHINCRGSHLPKSNAEYWENKITRNMQRDEMNYSKLEILGWNVIVIWECELKKSLFESRIEQLIRQIKGV